MSNLKLENAWSVIQEGLDEGAFPGAVAGVANHEQTLFLHAGGFSRTEPAKRTLKTDDLFDLASLTKPVATATLINLFRPFFKTGPKAITVKSPSGTS